MFTNYLFPHRYQALGWIIFLPAVLLGGLWLAVQPEWAFFDWQVPAFYTDSGMQIGQQSPKQFFEWQTNNVLDELISILLIVGGVLIAFSKEKIEDEFIAKIRLESLVWATYLNYAVLLLAVLFVYDLGFFWVLVLNMFTILLFFIIRFRWALRRSGTTAFAI